MKKKGAKRKELELLLYADSERDADMFYFSGVFVPDPFIAFSRKGKKIGVLSQLEFARVRKEGALDEVYPLEEWIERANKRSGPRATYPATVIAEIASAEQLSGFRVSRQFPAGLAFALRDLGLCIEPVEEELFPARETKTDAEAQAIRAGNRASAAGFRAVEKILREARIEGRRLRHNGRIVTSEYLQHAIAVACLEKGAVATQPIVAGGDQACDPHCRGHGPLRPHELIIVDIFPRVMKSGYHGDMTRTYLKGRPDEAQKALYETVYAAEQWALGEHRSRKSGAAIYDGVVKRFEEAGYPTRRDKGVPVGFIHGLGHGLGLDVHEAPRVNRNGSRLRSGQVITVEPGLYYPGLGGVRVEDVVRVTNKDPEMLSKHPYRWRIR